MGSCRSENRCISVVFLAEFDFDVHPAVTRQKSTWSSIFLFLGIRRADFFFGGVGAPIVFWRWLAQLWRGRDGGCQKSTCREKYFDAGSTIAGDVDVGINIFRVFVSHLVGLHFPALVSVLGFRLGFHFPSRSVARPWICTILKYLGIVLGSRGLKFIDLSLGQFRKKNII